MVVPVGAYVVLKLSRSSASFVRNHFLAGESEMSYRNVFVGSVGVVDGFGSGCVLDVGTLVALAVDDVAGCVNCDVETGCCIPYGSVTRARESI